MISHRCRYKGRGSVLMRFFTSSIDRCAAARVILAIPSLFWFQSSPPLFYHSTRIGMRRCAERRHLGTGASEPGHHQSGHREINKGFTTGVRALKIAGKPTVMRDPGIGAFHHPYPGKVVKPLGHDLVPIDRRSFWCPGPAHAGPRMIDDLETHPKVFLDPLLEWFARIPAIH